MNFRNACITATTLGLGLAGIASAETFRASTYNVENESTTVVLKWFIEELASQSNGEIDFELFTGGALMPARSQLSGVGDGVAQLSFHTSGYTPSELPLSNALSGFGFIEPDPTIIGAAWADWVMHDPAALAEYTGNNVVPVGGFSTPNYPALCSSTTPIVTLDDLKGKKIRLPGGLTSALGAYVGAVPVNIPAPEIYQALQTGQIDCAGIVPLWLNIDNTLDEVVRSITLLDWTGSYISPIHVYNRDWWAGLSDDQRRMVLDTAARASAKIQVRFTVLTEQAYNDARDKKGAVIVEPDASITDKVAEWVEAGVGDMAGVARSAYGVQDPEALFDSFTPYIEKWQGLLEGVDRTDEEAIAALFLEYLVGDLDPASYGLE